MVAVGLKDLWSSLILPTNRASIATILAVLFSLRPCVPPKNMNLVVLTGRLSGIFCFGKPIDTLFLWKMFSSSHYGRCCPIHLLQLWLLINSFSSTYWNEPHNWSVQFIFDEKTFPRTYPSTVWRTEQNDFIFNTIILFYSMCKGQRQLKRQVTIADLF